MSKWIVENYYSWTISNVGFRHLPCNLYPIERLQSYSPVQLLYFDMDFCYVPWSRMWPKISQVQKYLVACFALTSCDNPKLWMFRSAMMDSKTTHLSTDTKERAIWTVSKMMGAIIPFLILWPVPVIFCIEFQSSFWSHRVHAVLWYFLLRELSRSPKHCITYTWICRWTKPLRQPAIRAAPWRSIIDVPCATVTQWKTSKPKHLCERNHGHCSRLTLLKYYTCIVTDSLASANVVSAISYPALAFTNT